MEWIAEVTFDPEIEAKIVSKHQVTADEVREAVCFGHADEARWHVDPVYGRRLLVKGSPYHGHYRLFVVLTPLDRTLGRWKCKTAMRWTR